MGDTHFVSSTFEDLQSSQAIRFLCRYASPLAASSATCFPLQAIATPVSFCTLPTPCASQHAPSQAAGARLSSRGSGAL